MSDSSLRRTRHAGSGAFAGARWARRVLLAAPLVTVASVLLASPVGAATGLNPLLPNAVSPNGHSLYVLYNWISIPALAIFFMIQGLLLTIIIRDRRKRHTPDYRPPQTHGNTKLEIAWTVTPFALLLVILGFSFNELQNDFLVQNNVIAPNQGPTDLAITVSAHQFGWDYKYPEGFTVSTQGLNAADNPMVVPTGALVRITLQSTDVIHAFWVPEIGPKMDAVPGYDNFNWFKIPQPGEWRGQCTELCGVGHGTMQIRVKAVAPDEYRAWVAAHTAKPSPSPSAAAKPSPSPSAAVSPNPTPSGSARPSPSPSSR